MWMELLTVAAADGGATRRWRRRRNDVAAAASVSCDVGGKWGVVVAVIAAVPQLCPAANYYYSTAPSRPRSSTNAAAAAVPAMSFRVPEEVDVGGGSSGCFFGVSLPLAKVHHHPHGDVSAAGLLTLLLSHRRHWGHRRVASEAVLT